MLKSATVNVGLVGLAKAVPSSIYRHSSSLVHSVLLSLRIYPYAIRSRILLSSSFFLTFGLCGETLSVFYTVAGFTSFPV